MESYKYEKPYYTLYPSVYCSGEIWVNDVLVGDWKGERTAGHGGSGGDTPINQAILESGKYKVVGKMFPRYGKKTLTEEEVMQIEFHLAEADLDKWKASQTNFHPKIESPWGGLSENINYPYFEISTEIEVELPFVLDGWQNSVDLKEAYKDREEELKKEVLVYYRQLHALLAEHNASKFLELSKEKEELQSQAFYFTEERKKSFRDGASALFAQNLEVEPLREKELVLQFMGYGKLIRLIYADGSQPIQFKSPKPEEQSNIEFDTKLHMRSKEKGFSII